MVSTQQVFLRVPQVSARVGLSRSTIYRLAQEGRFPKPIKLGARASAWLLSDIESWQQQRINAARGDSQAEAMPAVEVDARQALGAAHAALAGAR